MKTERVSMKVSDGTEMGAYVAYPSIALKRRASSSFRKFSE